MPEIPALAAHLAPNTVLRLERAAKERYEDAERLKEQNRLLAALYLYGYSVEMCLTAAYFRGAGYAANRVISDDDRRGRMRDARNWGLMSADPHPLVGWAKFLEWQRLSSGSATAAERDKLQQAVRRAERVYKHWRPELRYKLTQVMKNQFDEVRQCVRWFIGLQGRL
jgi:hypothetical protein